MMVSSRANEIRELVRQLGSRDRQRVNAARARLSVLGSRAVEDLIAALDGDDNLVRSRAMPLLALTRDSRAREPLMAMLLDRNARIRQIASRSLGRFPGEVTGRALDRVLDRDSSVGVRKAVVQSLIEHYRAGHEGAIRRPLGLLVDVCEAKHVRLSAIALVEAIPRGQRAALLARLENDPEPTIRRRTAELRAADDESAAETGSGRLLAQIADLAASDYVVWNAAVQRLGDSGPEVVTPLLAEMGRRQTDAEYCTRVGMVLKALGPRRARAIVDALDREEAPLPLQVVVEVVGAFADKSMVYRLKDVIERISGDPDRYRRVRAKAHLELARVGSRVGIVDLRDALASEQFELEMVAAVELIGKPDELPLLLRAYERETTFVAPRIARAVRQILKRERIRRNSRALQTLSPAQRRLLDEIVESRAAERRSRPRSEGATL
ncbi:MAG TPA: HEAT repeat domain-containing protein [Candidatus Polarisedimenticolaceae bacterium]|nr:HEAT repeat domain-containing protein [Candidatus Polarisedimenticolaceae bacterium]